MFELMWFDYVSGTLILAAIALFIYKRCTHKKPPKTRKTSASWMDNRIGKP